MAGQVTETEVCIFLRMKVGGAVHDICVVYRVSPSTCYKWFRTILNVVCKRITMSGIPADELKLRRMAVKFAESPSGSSPLPGYVGALDGIQVTIEKPHSDLNPLHFYSRRGSYARTVQALVDSDYLFISCSCLTVGSTHFSLAFRLSSLCAFLEVGKLRKGFWIAGDEAYRVSYYNIIPLIPREAQLSRHENSLSIPPSKARGILEDS